MKRIVHINSMKNGSTGHIMNDLARKAREKGHVVYTSCGGNRYQRRLSTELPEYHLYIGGIFENKLHKILGTIFGCGGCYSHFATFVFLKKLHKIKPDLIHLHNLHSNYINLKMLFRYIKKKQIPVIWTLHDCWPFTGHCPHFSIQQCDKWMYACNHCPSYREYPAATRDDSAFMYNHKRKWFTGITNAVLVTPSKWLESLVHQSFLQEYPVQVIHNGIDLGIFKYRKSDFRQKYGLEDKIIILGVAFSWSNSKGLDIFIKLSEALEDFYQIVLVGLKEEDWNMIPSNMIGIASTESKEELAQIYSSCNLFVNPTRADNFPTTHLEALACGIPVITFRTGGAPESVDNSCGRVVEQDDFQGLLEAIHEITQGKEKISSEACRNKAECFSSQNKYKEYLELYTKLLRT